MGLDGFRHSVQWAGGCVPERSFFFGGGSADKFAILFHQSEFGTIVGLLLEDSLKSQYIVTKNTEPTSGLKTVTATPAKGPTLVFQERTAGALDIDTGAFDVQKMMVEFALLDPEAQKMLWRLLSENGMANNAKQATTTTRQQIKKLVSKAGKNANDALRDLNKGGRLRSTAPKDVLDTADRLAKSGILESVEFLEARGAPNQRGVVGEWLAKESEPAPSGSRVLRRVTVKANLFEDPEGKVPATDENGRPRMNAVVAETDLVYGRDVSGVIELDTVLNVKASGEKGMASKLVECNALRRERGWKFRFVALPIRRSTGDRSARLQSA